MGSKLELGVQMKKFLIIPIRTCYRSVCNHPFLVGMLCLLLFLYRSFPFVFSLLVTASPVLVCTAVLLATLLSFGQPNIPEIEKDDKVSRDISSLKAGLSGDATVVVERDESFVVERYSGKGRHIVDEADEASSAQHEVTKVEEDDGFDDYVPLIDVDESSREIQLEKRVSKEVGGEFHGLELENKREIHENLGVEGLLSDGEAVENQYSMVQEEGDEILQVESDTYLGESVDAHKRDHLDLYPDGDNDDDDGESSDSGSDRAESSSPDASMADIIPILDELHPLLDLDAPRPAHMSNDESDAASERSHYSNDGSAESDEELGNEGEEVEEDGVDENEDDEEEEEAQGDKDDESKSAIKWTEIDQKNLMDLGTSELERNQRLENLIARRRARKNLRLVAEKNLIDLDSADLPFNVPPISTTRSNPFDLPYDSYDPPGSAPSIMVPRRNPFDLPYDSNEEKPNLKGDSFQQEFMAFPQKDTFFRRHESFNVGPSVLGGARQERHDIKLRPFFVPDRFASEGTTYSSFQRQSSEVSESKLSSVPDTESVSSVGDHDDKKLNEQDFHQEIELLSNLGHSFDRVEHVSQSSEDVDSVEMEEVEKRNVHHDEVEITLGEFENHHEIDLGLPESEGAATPTEFSSSNIDLKSEPLGEEYSSRSSLSSLSEIDEEISEAKIEESTSLKPRGNRIEESGSSVQPSLEESDTCYMSGEVDENQHEPVYDSSPTADNESEVQSESKEKKDTFNHEEMHAASSKMGLPPVSVETTFPIADNESEVHSESIEKDTSNHEEMHAASSEMDLPPVSVETTFPIADNESEVHSENKEKDTFFNHEEMHAASSKEHLEEENESRSKEVQEVNKKDVTTFESSGVDLGNQNGSVIPEPMVEHVSVDSSSSSFGFGSVEEVMVNKEESFPYDNKSEVDSESKEKDTFNHEEMHAASSKEHLEEENESRSREVREVNKNDITTFESLGVGLGNQNGSVIPEPMVEHVPVDSSSSFNFGSVEEGMVYEEESFPYEQDRVGSSSIDSKILVGVQQDVREKLDSAASGYQMASENITLSGLEEQRPSVVVEHVSVLSSETEPVGQHTIGKEETLQHEQDQVYSSTSSDNGSVGDVLMHKDKIFQSEQDQVHSSSFDDAEIRVVGHQDGDEKLDLVASSLQHIPSSDLTLSAPEERQPPLATEQVLVFLPKLSSSKTEHAEDHSLKKEETFNVEHDEVHSSSSDAKIDAGLHQQLDVKVVSSGSSGQYVLSEEKPPSELEKQSSWSDKSMVEPTFNDHDEGQESSISLTESTEAVEIAKNGDVPEIHDHEGTVLPKLSSLASSSSVSLEYKSSTGGVDLEDNFLGGIVNEDHVKNSENLSHSEEAYGSRIAKQTINEEEDEIKDIDEDLLSELDTVGDFSVKEVVGEPLHAKLIPEETNVGSTEFGLLPKDLNTTKTVLELPVLEARSLEDIDLAFKQLNEGVNVEEVILPSMIDDWLVVEDSKDPVETNSDFKVVEAKSLEDIQIALKQVSEDNLRELPEMLDSKDGSASVELYQVSSMKEIESNDVGSGVQETSTVTADKPEDGFDKTSENSSLSISDTGSKEAKIS